MYFRDRKDAGEKLAICLYPYRKAQQTIITGLARDEVILAFEVATRLHFPINIIVPRKVGAPQNEELAI